MAAETLLLIFTTVYFSLLSGCSAGEVCGRKICEHSCCDFDESECCAEVALGLIVGLVVAAGVFTFVVIIVICLCRRRRYHGHVYQSHPPGSTVIVQQGINTTQSGVLGTTGMPPGIAYPPNQSYIPPPGAMTAPPYSAIAPPYSVAAPPYMPPPGMTTYSAAPPDYESLTHQSTGAEGGIENKGFASEQKSGN